MHTVDNNEQTSLLLFVFNSYLVCNIRYYSDCSFRRKGIMEVCQEEIHKYSYAFPWKRPTSLSRLYRRNFPTQQHNNTPTVNNYYVNISRTQSENRGSLCLYCPSRLGLPRFNYTIRCFC